MLEKEQTVLVIVDVQGKLAQLMHDKDALFKNLTIITSGAKQLNLPILWLEQYPEGLGPTIPELQTLLTEETPIAKRCFSCCGNEDFMKKLKETKRTQILLVGIETHICVYQTARDLLSLGYEVEVVVDAVSSRKEMNKRVGIEKMIQLGASMTSVEMALFELLKEAKGDAFKQISKLIK